MINSLRGYINFNRQELPEYYSSSIKDSRQHIPVTISNEHNSEDINLRETSRIRSTGLSYLKEVPRINLNIRNSIKERNKRLRDYNQVHYDIAYKPSIAFVTMLLLDSGHDYIDWETIDEALNFFHVYSVDGQIKVLSKEEYKEKYG